MARHTFLSVRFWMVGLLALCVSAGCGKSSPVIKIGLVAPLTGDQASIGQDLIRGAQLAIDQANVKGVLAGYSLVLEALDDQHSPAQAVAAAKKLVADPDVAVIVGHLNSSCTMPTSAIYHTARLLQIAPVASNPQLSRQGFDTFYRTCATDDLQGPAAANFAMKELNVRRIAIIDDMTTYGRGLSQEFEQKAKTLGMEIVAHEGISQGEKDFSALLTKIKGLDPDLIYFAGVYPESALLLRQRAALGLRGHYLGSDGQFDPALISLAAPEAAEGAFVTTVGSDIHQMATAQAFIQAFEQKYGTVGAYAAYAYEATSIGIEAIRRAASKDRTAVLQAMQQIKDFPGIFGVQNFDARGDSLIHNIGIYTVKDGAFVFLKTLATE